MGCAKPQLSRTASSESAWGGWFCWMIRFCSNMWLKAYITYAFHQRMPRKFRNIAKILEGFGKQRSGNLLDWWKCMFLTRHRHRLETRCNFIFICYFCQSNMCPLIIRVKPGHWYLENCSLYESKIWRRLRLSLMEYTNGNLSSYPDCCRMLLIRENARKMVDRFTALNHNVPCVKLRKSSTQCDYSSYMTSLW